MDDERAPLSAIATALDELTGRITELADTYQRTSNEQLAIELYEIERALQQAARRLERLTRPA
jgi:uncharacterized protein YukE